MKIKSLALLLIILSLALTGVAQTTIPEQLLISTGQGNGSGARAYGLAGTYTGIADDYSSIWWNPAGLAQIKRIELQASLSRSGISNDASYYGVTREGSASNLRLNNVGIVFPIPVYQGALTFAFGYSQVHGFDSKTEFASPSEGSYYWDSYNELLKGRLGLWSLAGAMDVTPNLALGIGVNYWSGARDKSYTGWYTDINTSQYTESTTNTSLRAWGANFGGLFRLGRFARLGAMVQTPLAMNLDEEWSYGENNGYFDYRMTYPAVFRVGASVAPGRWLVAADLEYRDWTSMEFRSETPYEGVGRASANQQIQDEYKSVTRLSVGGEYLFPAYGVRARAGYAIEPNNYKPLGSDADRNIFAFGVGVLVDRSVMLDVGLQFTSYKMLTVDGSDHPGTQVTEDVSRTTALFTISYRM